MLPDVGIRMPSSPACSESRSTIVSDERRSTAVEQARIHCGPTRRVSRELTCTPVTTPSELMAKSSPNSCALSP